MRHLKRTSRSYTASYSCNTYSRYGKEYCTMHYIRYDKLYDIVLNDIRRNAGLAKNDELEFVEALSKSGSYRIKTRLLQYERDMETSEKCLSEIGLIIKRLYEDNVIGNLTSERFIELSRGYESESTMINAHIHELKKAAASCSEASDNSLQFTALIQKYSDIKELDALTLNALVSKIEVHERVIINGKREQKVDIFYNFVGNIS